MRDTRSKVIEALFGLPSKPPSKNRMNIKIRNLAIGGYRSFGPQIQYFEKFSRINLLIGKNNSGKSNVLRFLSEIYPAEKKRVLLGSDPLSRHIPGNSPLTIGSGVEVEFENDIPILPKHHPLAYGGERSKPNQKAVSQVIAKICKKKIDTEKTNICWSIQTIPESGIIDKGWVEAIKSTSDNDLYFLWRELTGHERGSRDQHWEPDVIKIIRSKISPAQVETIPAIRQIGAKGSTASSFNGDGIIERLAKLQNPSSHEQRLRDDFIEITEFLRNVTDNPEATIEVPYERDTINIHMDGKTLPLESLGSGIHEVLILAVASTVLIDHVVCIEEPELHLNPVLQRKLMHYLAKKTTNQYFISTHSAALMDTPNAEIYHIRLENGSSIVERTTSNRQRSNVCMDLGYHPSDLLQANCIIWIEGPSDRIYINHWLKAKASHLIEDIHYSIMFYGGKLAAHISYADIDSKSIADDFVSLRNLNRRSVIVIDSDRENPKARINETKKRLQAEFDSGPGFAWITQGREVENYIPPPQLKEAISRATPRATISTTMGKFDNCLKIVGGRGAETQAPKVEVARLVSENSPVDFSVLDLNEKMDAIVKFIAESNPKISAS